MTVDVAREQQKSGRSVPSPAGQAEAPPGAYGEGGEGQCRRDAAEQSRCDQFERGTPVVVERGVEQHGRQGGAERKPEVGHHGTQQTVQREYNVKYRAARSQRIEPQEVSHDDNGPVCRDLGYAHRACNRVVQKVGQHKADSGEECQRTDEVQVFHKRFHRLDRCLRPARAGMNRRTSRMSGTESINAAATNPSDATVESYRVRGRCSRNTVMPFMMLKRVRWVASRSSV